MRRVAATRIVLAAGLLVSWGAVAQPLFADGELEGVLVGRSVAFPSGALAAWQAGGRYSYRLGRGGRVWNGRYTISGDGVCVELFGFYGDILGVGWGGMGTCFRIARDGDQYRMIDGAGRSFPLTRDRIEPQQSRR